MAISIKLNNFSKTIAGLESAFNRNWLKDDCLRDSVIRRFVFAVETCWKYYQAYFLTQGEKINFSKDVFRKAREAGLLNEDEAVLALEMIDDRNMTSHTYEESLAQEISERVLVYFPILQKLHQQAEA